MNRRSAPTKYTSSTYGGASSRAGSAAGSTGRASSSGRSAKGSGSRRAQADGAPAGGSGSRSVKNAQGPRKGSGSRSAQRSKAPGKSPGSRRNEAPARRARKGPPRHARPLRMRWGVAAVLALVIIACGLFYGPLRDFVKQEDAYQKELAALKELKRQNRVMKAELAAVESDTWIAREARSQFQLVPQGTQAFVVTDLPSGEGKPKQQTAVKPVTMSLGQRLSDLWRALLR